MTVAVLYAARDSVYKTMAGCDVWDADRDARGYDGPYPVVAHPPCRTWSRMRYFARHNPEEHELGPLAVRQVRHWGGVLEHPAGSALWPAQQLPAPGQRDAWGFTIGVPQFWWGHLAEKRTLLYVVGVPPTALPPMAFQLGEAPCTVSTSERVYRNRPEIPKRLRAATPPAFAEWLVAIASRAIPPRAFSMPRCIERDGGRSLHRVG